MRKLELITGIILIIALTMHFFLIPWISILFLFSSMILICLYYPLGFAFFNRIPIKHIFKKDSYRDISALRIIGSIGAGLGLSATCAGVLFKLLHYPGAELILLVGIVVNSITLLLAMIRYSKSKDTFYTKIFKRIIVVGGFGFQLTSSAKY